MIKLKAKSIENVAERAKERALGKLNEGMRIGILVSHENFSGARNYSLKLAYSVQNAILKNGLETEIITLPTICDRYKDYTTENNFLEIYKTQLANMVELLLTEKSYDGLVIMAKGISSKMGMLIGASRVNLPTIVFGEGPSSNLNGNTLNDILDMVGKVSLGKASSFDLQAKEENQSEYVGEGVDFNVSNLLNIMLEASGLSVVGNSTIEASTIAREKLCQETANAIVNMTKDHMTIRKVVTKKDINNLINLNYALGGSTQIIEHILTLANELDLDFTLDKILSMSKGVNVYYDVTQHSIQDFKQVGGIFALLKVLAKDKLFDESTKSYNGFISDNYKNIKINEAFTPMYKCAHINLKGNIANKFSIAKSINIKDLDKFDGKVRVFSDDDSASIGVLSKSVPKNTVIVVKNCNRLQSFGGSTINQTCMAITSMGFENDYVVLTEGNIPDQTKAKVIGLISPNGEDGVLRLLQDGDNVEIDFVKAKINVDLSNKEITLREKKYIKETKSFPKFAKNYIKSLSK